MFAKDQIFAVVDIETTGTNSKEGDRIMQIGAVFVQNNKIVNTFATNINPEHPIPEAVQRLTALTPAMLASAPVFDDVALTLWHQLQNTVFVAHNINFDLPFLNSEFERIGLDPLNIAGVDTVPLAQILLPSAPGYRLADLTQLLGIEHIHPHRADSDARATGELFIKLFNLAKQLPLVTLLALKQLPIELPRQTAEVIVTALDIVERHNPALASDLVIVDGLALQKLRDDLGKNETQVKFPSTKKEKTKLYGNQLSYRGEQAKFMNVIYNNFTHENAKPLLLEAPTGLGKSLGYLLPMAYLAGGEEQVVISTATKLLQNQLANVITEQLDALLTFTPSVVVVKGQHHYLDLVRFKRSLMTDDQNFALQFTKMRLLVWLTQTTTGDLDELQIGSLSPAFRDQITHHSTRVNQQFGAYDFYSRLQHARKHAQFVIVNHAYLAKHANEFKNEPYLVVDEAQHLPSDVLHVSRKQLRFRWVLGQVHNLEVLIQNSHGRDLTELFDNIAAGRRELNSLRDNLRQLSDGINRLQTLLYRSFLLNVKLAPVHGVYERRLTNESLVTFLSHHGELINALIASTNEIHQHFGNLQQIFNDESGRWLANDRVLLAEFIRAMVALDEGMATLIDLRGQLADYPESSVFWLSEAVQNDTSNLILSGALITTKDYFTRNLYPYFKVPVFVGATLFSSARSQYIYDQLNLDKNMVATKRFKEVFDYANHAQLLIAKDAPNPSETNHFLYTDYLARQISGLLLGTHKKALILFNSLQTIEQVTHLLQADERLNEFNILAQGVTGTRTKVLRRFKDENNSVLLGTSSFWEGIDLPAEQLELLVITRLPFESPDSIVVRAQNEWMEQQKRNPFFSLALPKAILQLRQGIGRLLRSPDDIGLAVILDARIVTKQYGKTMQNALPNELPVSEIASSELAKSARKFFDANKPTE
ncbi:helicase C-terminal domain-containing protein [Periweissella cryptocerci]|uniref:helicase C-terminal domain-containing protein n=1 Tax=Periweissella cryptocerci TaxID=2506420 RepID=UPI0014052DD9|nr:helicase C-terminal domain-containing protein [Periweissella cryptocerci]